MEVKEFQNKIVAFAAQWDKKRKTTPNKELTFYHLVEELGEYSREYVNKKSRKEKYNKKEEENAIGDMLMQLVKLAHLHNLDIEKTVLKIIKEEQKRFLD